MATIEINGTEIHYRDQGFGEPVILVHSSACSGGQWRSLIDDLGPGYRILTPDLHGYGRSAFWSGRGPLRLADEAEIIERLIGVCGGPVHLVGHSYGGAVALRVAWSQPEMIKSLTLIEPVALNLLRNSDPAGAPFTEVRVVADRVAQSISTGDFSGAMQCFYDYWNGLGAWSRLSDQRQADLIKVAPKVALDFSAISSEPVRLDDYRRVDLPTLLICGQESPRSTRRITALLGGALPGALVQVVGGAGHMLPLTHHQRVNTLIFDHLRGSGQAERLAA